MSIKFNCPHCTKPLSVRDDLAGKRAKCPKCQQALTIPAPVSRPADLEAFAAAALSEQPKTAAPEPKPATIEFQCYYCDEKVSVSVELCGKQTPCPE
jgi:transcription elongation factor Elf1